VAAGGWNCALCRSSRPIRVNNALRVWWLVRFDDDEFAAMSAALFGSGDPVTVAAWRLGFHGQPWQR
jgi:hypothetical protein